MPPWRKDSASWIDRWNDEGVLRPFGARLLDIEGPPQRLSALRRPRFIMSTGEWLRMSHSVAKRLVFANELAKTTSFAEIFQISEAARRFNPKD